MEKLVEKPGTFARTIKMYSFVRTAMRDADRAGLRIYATSLAYRALFTVISLLSVLVLASWVLKDYVDGSTVDRLLNTLPSDVQQAVNERAHRTLDGPVSNVVLAALLGIVLSLWGMAGGFAAVFDALNRIYGTYKYTRYTVRYLRATFIAMVFMAFAGSAFLVAALSTEVGEVVLETLHLNFLVGLTGATFRIVSAFILAIGAFGIVYRWGSFARPRWTDVIASALLAGSAWTLMSVGLFFVLDYTSPFDTYGALASAVTVLLYGYWTSYLLFIAALFSPALGSVIDYLLGRGHFRFELAPGADSSQAGSQSKQSQSPDTADQSTTRRWRVLSKFRWPV
jgi:uncharacterized BrkB/YihY/UPF0761 family membrane protein